MNRTEIREVELPDGDKFFIELSMPGTADVRVRPAVAVAWSSIEHQIAAVSRSVVRTVRDALPDKPTRYSVEFGVKLTAETGTVLGALARVCGESTIVVRVEWEPAQSGDRV